jgi:ADP-ribose pyrophosphatase
MDVPQKQDTKILIDKYGKRVVAENFLLPNGKVIEFLAIDSSKTAAIIFPLTEDNKVVAIRQFRYAINDFIIELPGGTAPTRESFEETAREELLEETGFAAKKIIQLSHGILIDPAFSKAHFVPMLALDCIKEKRPKLHPDEIEFIEVVEVPLAEWIEKINGGEIRDSKSIALTHLALLHLAKL